MAEPRLTAADIARFWSHVAKAGADECWLWTGGVVKGYGQFSIASHPFKAHRIAWLIEHGSLPADKCVCHECDTPLCMNPRHHWLGTNPQNTRDKVNKGRQAAGTALGSRIRQHCLRGEQLPHSKLTAAGVRLMRARAAAGVSFDALAVEFGVSSTAIRKAVTRRSWAHVA